MHGLLRCNINAGVHAVEADVSLRDVTIAQMGNGPTECVEDFEDFEKVSLLS